MLADESVEERLARIETKLDSIVNWLVDDHEQRLRKLERWRYGLPLTAIVALASVALSVAAVYMRLG